MKMNVYFEDILTLNFNICSRSVLIDDYAN